MELTDQRSLRYMPQTTQEIKEVMASMPGYRSLLSRRRYLEEDFQIIEDTIKWLSVMTDNIFEISYMSLLVELVRGEDPVVLSGPITLATWSPEAYFVTRALRKP